MILTATSMSKAKRPLVLGVRTALTVAGWWLIASRLSGVAAWMALAALLVAGDLLTLALARERVAPRTRVTGVASTALSLASGLCLAAAVTPWTGRFTGFQPWLLAPAALLLVLRGVLGARSPAVGSAAGQR